jgi:hypothetical protein
MSLDSAELESKAEVDEPVEYRDADDDPKLQVSKQPDPEDVCVERRDGGAATRLHVRVSCVTSACPCTLYPSAAHGLFVAEEECVHHEHLRADRRE